MASTFESFHVLFVFFLLLQFLVFEKDFFKVFPNSNCNISNLLCLVHLDVRGLGEVTFTIYPPQKKNHLRIFDVLSNFSFTAGETKPDY